MNKEETKVNELTIKEFEEIVGRKIKETLEVKRKKTNREETIMGAIIFQSCIFLFYGIFISLLVYAIFHLFSLLA